LGERSDVAGQPVRCRFGLPRKLQLGGKLLVWITLTCMVDLGLQLLALRPDALGDSVLARPSHWLWM
jgi:hypothetical protein